MQYYVETMQYVSNIAVTLCSLKARADKKIVI